MYACMWIESSIAASSWHRVYVFVYAGLCMLCYDSIWFFELVFETAIFNVFSCVRRHSTQLNSTNYVYTIYSQCTISFVQLYHFNRTIFVWYLLNRSSVTYTCSQHLAEWHRTEEWARRQCWENEWEIYAAAERCWHQFTNVKTKREREKSSNSSDGSSNEENKKI